MLFTVMLHKFLVMLYTGKFKAAIHLYIF